MKYVFNSQCMNLTVVLKPSRKLVAGTEVVREPGVRAQFVRGLFETEDEGIAQRLRDVMAKDRSIVEITAEDQRAFAEPAQAANQRGPATAQDLKAPEKPKVSEVGESLTCPICDPPKTFASRKELNLHLVSHRNDNKAVKAAKVAEKEPAPAE